MYTSRPCALGRKQSNEGLGDSLQKQAAKTLVAVGFFPPLLLEFFIFYPIGAPCWGWFHQAVFRLYSLIEELENRWKTLPRS